jgi:ribonuclease P protein component
MTPRSLTELAELPPVAAMRITAIRLEWAVRRHRVLLRGGPTGGRGTIESRASGRCAAAHPFAREFRRLVARPGTEEAMSEENVSAEQPQAGQAARVSSPHVDARRSGHNPGPPAQRPSPAVGLIWRVDRRQTFAALRQARRHRHGPLTVSWVAGDPSEPPRVAYTIGRRVGSAVVRNRVRRRLRMLVREAAPRLAPGCYLIGVGPEAASLSYHNLRTVLLKVLKYIEAP